MDKMRMRFPNANLQIAYLCFYVTMLEHLEHVFTYVQIFVFKPFCYLPQVLFNILRLDVVKFSEKLIRNSTFCTYLSQRDCFQVCVINTSVVARLICCIYDLSNNTSKRTINVCAGTMEATNMKWEYIYLKIRGVKIKL